MDERWLLWRVAPIAMVILLGADPIPGHAQSPKDLVGLDKQAVQLYRAGKYAEALEVAKQSLALAERQFGADHVEVCPPLNNLAAIYDRLGQYAEAERLYRRALAIREKALKPDHPDIGLSLNNLAGLYFAQGRHAEAEPLYKRSLAIRQKAFGPDDALVAEALNNLAALHRDQGRYAEAEPLHQRALAIREKVLGPEHRDVATSLNNLALLYKSQGRNAEAEPLYKRSLAIREKVLGPDHPDVALLLTNLATLYRDQGRYAEAEPLFIRGLAIREKVLGPDHRSVGTSLNNLALLYRDQGRYAEAEPLFKRSLAIREKALGREHHEVGDSYNNLALLYWTLGRYAEAEPLYKRALAISESALGPDHPHVGRSFSNLAVLYFVQRDWATAAEYWRRNTAVLVRRTRRGNVSQVLTGTGKGEAEQSSDEFRGFIKAAHRSVLEGRGAEATLAREMFEMAQWAQGSEAAASLAQMAARGAKGDAALAGLVRERQDLVGEWQKRDAARTAAVSQSPDRRDRAGEAANVARLAAIDARIIDIDKTLKDKFPDYAALVSPAPLPVAEVQASLRSDEALVLFFDTSALSPAPEETFIWVVTKTGMRWLRSDLGTAALAREVAALRCGLDAANWSGDSANSCGKLLGISPALAAGEPLPFDRARAHTLYKALFGGAEDLIQDKHLLVVPSGPLTQLPFQVLVTTPPPAQADHRTTAWLARTNAITVLPAVSSLKALRRVARPSGATKPIIGFGNPLLDGPDQRYAERARLARENQRCPETQVKQVAVRRGGLRIGVASIATRSGIADLAYLKAQTPLPETADELCAVARDLGADAREIRLGARASETEVKALSEAGALAGYRIVHFATHGTLAGDLKGTSEPGLILTPPATSTERDDGYLSAGEIAELKLDADWVILSACNTAAGGAAGAEALSGLARAFFYAQARALLVSHWEVDSAATVRLIVDAVGALSRDAKLGRAEALRRAMLAMIDKGQPRQAHPAFWSPFVVVGEGAR